MGTEEVAFEYGSEVALNTTLGPVAFTFSSLADGVPPSVVRRCTGAEAVLCLRGNTADMDLQAQENQIAFVKEALTGLLLKRTAVINATPLVKNGTLAAMKLLALPRVIAGHHPGCTTLSIARRTNKALVPPPHARRMSAQEAGDDFFANPAFDAVWYIEASQTHARQPDDLLSQLRHEGATLATWVWGGSLGVIDALEQALYSGHAIAVVDGTGGMAQAVADVLLRRTVIRPTSYHSAVRERLVNAQLDIDRISVLQSAEDMHAWLIETGIATTS